MQDKNRFGLLLKHAIKETWKGILIACIAIFVSYLLQAGFVLIFGLSMLENYALFIIYAIFVMFAEIINIAGFVVLLYYIFKTINQKMFTNEGYLTFTLPVTTDELILSRIVTNLIYIVVVLIVTILGNVTVSLALAAREIAEALANGTSIIDSNALVPASNVNPLYYIGQYLDYFLNIVFYLVTFIMSLAIVHSSSSGKSRKFVAFVLFIGILIGVSIVQSLLALIPCGFGLTSENIIKFGIGFKNNSIVAYPIDFFNIILLIGLTIGFYFITRKLLSKRLELL